MAQITEWIASLVGGRAVRRGEMRAMMGDPSSRPGERVAIGLTSLAPGQIECVNVETDHPALPLVRMELSPERGDHAHCFTRTMAGPNGRGTRSVPVFEVTPDPACPDRFVRVYLLDDRIVISTRDLYW